MTYTHFLLADLFCLIMVALVGAAMGAYVWGVYLRKNFVRINCRRCDNKLLQTLLKRLHELAESAAERVGRHSDQLEWVNDQLRNPAAHGPDAIAELVEGLVDANQEMQKQLDLVEARLHEQSELIELQANEVNTDALTELPNRRVFDESMQAAYEAFYQNDAKFAITMIDVDHFKQFNDTHGHRIGDDVLKLVASTLRERVKTNETPVRYGGEEFAVIHMDTGLIKAAARADALREAIENAVFEANGNRLQVTVSTGVAESSDDDRSFGLLDRADLCLYASKEAGRNCTHYHDGLNIHRYGRPNEPLRSGFPTAAATKAIKERRRFRVEEEETQEARPEQDAVAITTEEPTATVDSSPVADAPAKAETKRAHNAPPDLVNKRRAEIARSFDEAMRQESEDDTDLDEAETASIEPPSAVAERDEEQDYQLQDVAAETEETTIEPPPAVAERDEEKGYQLQDVAAETPRDGDDSLHAGEEATSEDEVVATDEQSAEHIEDLDEFDEDSDEIEVREGDETDEDDEEDLHRKKRIKTLRRARKARKNAIVAAKAMERVSFDMMPSLPNRTFFCSALGKQLAEFRRGGNPVAALLLRIDGMQEIQEKYGKQAVAMANRVMGQFLTTVSRDLDTPSQLDESTFAIFISDATEPQAVRMGERLRKVAAQCVVPFDGKQIRFTISVGVGFSTISDSSQSILARAEQALEYASRQGGNQSCIHTTDGVKVVV